MDEDDVRRQVEEAVEEERRKWEKVVASQNQAEEATSKQVAHLTAQLQEIREQQKEHAEKVEQEVAERIEKHVKELTDKHSDEMKKVRLECLTREKASIGRIREDSSRALLVERQANEATIMSLGEAEDERVRKKVAQAKASFEKQLQEKEQELKAAGQRIAELEKMVPTDGPNSENLRETVKRERKRTRQAEKQLESAAAEIEQLKQKLLDSKQLHYQGSLENVARAPPETAKLYRQMEQYKNEAKMLRQQLDAQMPGKLFELQSNMKMNTEERDKLKEEVKTLQQILSRQERVIQANKEQDSEHAQKVQVVYGDLQVAKAETLRLKEKLEVAEKGLVSRQKIEEGLRTRAEKAEKRCKAIEGRLREARGKGGGDSSYDGRCGEGGGGAEGGARGHEAEMPGAGGGAGVGPEAGAGEAEGEGAPPQKPAGALLQGETRGGGEGSRGTGAHSTNSGPQTGGGAEAEEAKHRDTRREGGGEGGGEARAAGHLPAAWRERTRLQQHPCAGSTQGAVAGD